MAEPNSNKSLVADVKSRVQALFSCARDLAARVAKSALYRRAIWIGIPILLFAWVVRAFLPSLHNGFIDYDDALFVTANPQVQHGLALSSVGWAFCHPVAGNWHPLTTLSHMLDCQLYGLKPWGHHLTSLLLHATSTVLLFLAFRRMTGAVWRSAFLAALFALHPLRVESVAWISERKDVLSTLFFMLTLWAYGCYVERKSARSEVTSQESAPANPPDASRTTHHAPRFTVPASRFYLLCLLFFALGLMCKPMLVTLPFVLLLLDYWPLQRLRPTDTSPESPGLGRLLAEKAPFFALAAIACVVALHVQAGAGAVGTTTQFPPWARMQNALFSYGRYLGKFFWPMDLSPAYPYPARWPVASVLLGGELLVGLSVIAFAFGLKRRYVLTGWFWFVGTLVPVIGLVQVGSQSLADRYTYIPSIGLLLVLVWSAHALTARSRYGSAVMSLVAVAAALWCANLTRQQISYWKDDETVWRHTLAVTENNDLASYNLGVIYFNQGLALATKGSFDEAIRYYEKAIQLSPEKEDAHSSLAYAFLKQRRFAEATREYEQVLRLNPNDAEAHNNLGNMLARQGHVEEALPHFTEALRLKADYPEAHDNFGAALAARGHYAEAAAQFREVLRLKPDYTNATQKLERALAAQQHFEQAAAPYRRTLQSNPGDAQAHAGLGRVLLEAGQSDEALEQWTEAARLDPKNPEFHYHVAAALARKGDLQGATVQFDQVLELDPQSASAHYGLGVVQQLKGNVPEACDHWRTAARLAPQLVDPVNNLAWVLATDPRDELRNGPEAVKLARRAVELAGTNNLRMLDTLAAAYAEAGRFAEATATARQAEAAATAQGQEAFAEQVRQRRKLYDSNEPYRVGPAP